MYTTPQRPAQLSVLSHSTNCRVPLPEISGMVAQYGAVIVIIIWIAET
jgi:hypothetical protein